MKYYFSKFKFTTQLFYSKISLATVKVYKDCFIVKIEPYFNYSGNFFLHSIYSQDKEKTVYRTFRVEPDIFEVDLENISPLNEYFIGVYFSRNKLTIFQSDLEGIILKT